MSESANFRSEFSREMDCFLCKGRLEDPRVLSCRHSYCRSCLDNVILFRCDGSGFIFCPMGCNSDIPDVNGIPNGMSVGAFISRDETTHDLPVPSRLKDSLDSFNRQSIKHEKSTKRLNCAYKPGCESEASLYCLVCKRLFCSTCHQNHDSGHTDLPVKYDLPSEQVKVLCTKHNTGADYFCCDKIICIYCKNREHTHHIGVDEIKVQASKVKEILLDPDFGVCNIKSIVSNSVKNYEATELSISLLRKMLLKTLRNRKLKGLREYLLLLEKEEKRIACEFDDIVKEQLQRYPRPVSTDFYNSIMEREDFEFVLNKREVSENIALFTKTIPVLKLGLTNSNTLRPLGDLSIERNDFVTIYNRHTSASVLQSSTGFNQVALGSEHLEKLKCLLKESMQSIERIYGSQEPYKQVQDKSSMVTSPQNSSSPYISPVSDIKDNLETTESTMGNAPEHATSQFTSVDSERLESVMSEINRGRGLNCIRDLCKLGNEELILSVLELHPSVASMKNFMGNTLLHFAASFGCLKVLSYLLTLDFNAIDTPNSLGSTPLHYAAENGHVDCVELLLSSNCRADLENISGSTALALANKLNNAEIITLFDKYMTLE